MQSTGDGQQQQPTWPMVVGGLMVIVLVLGTFGWMKAMHGGTSRVQAARPIPEAVQWASHTDWKERARAFEELAAAHGDMAVPLRDTPIAEREDLLLDWVGAYLPDWPDNMWCEIHASAVPVHFGPRLIARCADCHAVGPPQTTLTSCRECHGAVYDQGYGSAHMQSLSHLSVSTIDPVSRDVVPADFGGRVGISCIGCHQPQGEHPQCAATFTTRSCADCHVDAGRQWRQWTQTPRPERATWPAGSILFTEDPPRSCVDCHMPGGEHRWPARREPERLAAGVALDLQRNPGGDVVLVLTNLSGHSYPTGTRRRGIRVYASVDGAPEQRVTALAMHVLPADVEQTAPALAPGEQREIVLPAGQLYDVRLEYLRNRFEEGRWPVPVIRLTRQIPPR